MKNIFKPMHDFPSNVKLDIVSMLNRKDQTEGQQKCISFMLGIDVVSEANRHEIWQVRNARVKAQRNAVGQAVSEQIKGRGKPYTVSLCRLASRKLDSAENLPMAFKAVKDELCAILGFDDRDDSVRWLYSQEKPADKVYGITILIDWQKPVCCPSCGQILPTV